MQPPYQPTSVSRPVPPSVQRQIDKTVAEQQASGVQTNVTVNVVNNVPDNGAGSVLRFFLWVLVSPLIGTAALIVIGILILHPWIIAALVIGVCVWAVLKINQQ